MENQQPTGEAKNSQKKEWYTNWWGIILAILFLPIFLIWYIWARMKCSAILKATLTVVVLFFTLIAVTASNSPSEKNSSQASSPQTQPVASQPAQDTSQAQPSAQPTQTADGTGLNVSRDTAIKVFTAEEPGLDFQAGTPISEPGTPIDGQDNYNASVSSDGIGVQLIGPQDNLSQIAVDATIDTTNGQQEIKVFNLMGVSAGLVDSKDDAASQWLNAEVKNYPANEDTAYNHTKTFGNVNYDIQSTPIAGIPSFILTITASSDVVNQDSAQPSPTPSAPTPKSLLNLTGSGTKTTQKFTADGDWDLTWTYNCSKFGSQGNFQVYVYNGDGSVSFDNANVNQLGSKDSGVENYHTGGTFYLVVNSECSWTVKVQG